MTLYVKCADPTIRKYREDICQSVLRYFPLAPSDPRLFCFIDDEDCQWLRQKFGLANRGVQGALEAGKEDSLRKYLRQYLLDDAGNLLFDNLIYVHGSTCEPDVSLAITCSHEMQHFAQHCHNRKLKEVDSLFCRSKELLGFTKWEDHPIEQEALWKSKTVAIDLYGEASVTQYAEFQIAESQRCSSASASAKQKMWDTEAGRWRYFLNLPAGGSFDLATVTNEIIQKHRKEFQRLISDVYFNDPILASVDFAAPSWWT